MRAFGAFYDALGGQGWKKQDSWNRSDVSYCSYFGVHCNHASQPTVISLPGNNLVGSLSDLALNFSTLEALDIGDNLVSGSLPSRLGSLLPTLQVLNAPSNQLQSPLPALPHRLRHVYLGGNQLGGQLDASVFPPRIETVRLGANRFTGTVPDMHHMRSLRVLHLYENGLTGPIPKSFLTFHHLESLLLFDNHLSASQPFLAGINALHRLKFLVLSGNHLKGTLPQRWDAASSRLTLLSLGGNKLEGSIPADLIALPSIRVIQLSGNRFSGMMPAIADNSSIETLELSYNILSGALPPRLPSSLRVFSVRSNIIAGVVTPDVLAMAARPTTTRFHIDLNRLSCRLPAVASSSLSHYEPGGFAVLEGNLFDCPIPSGIQAAAPDGRSYLCGNSSEYVAIAACGACLVLFLVGLLIHYFEYRGTVPSLPPRSEVRHLVEEAAKHRRRTVHLRYSDSFRRIASARQGMAAASTATSEGMAASPPLLATASTPLVRAHNALFTPTPPDRPTTDVDDDSVSTCSAASDQSLPYFYRHYLRLAEAVDFQHSEWMGASVTGAMVLVAGAAAFIYVKAPSPVRCLLMLDATAVFVEGKGVQWVSALILFNLLLLGAWYWSVRRSRYELWETRVGEEVERRRRLPRFLAYDSQWRSCCVLVVLAVQVALVCVANGAYVVMEQSTSLSALGKRAVPLALAALKAALTVTVVPWMTQEVLVHLFQHDTHKATFKTIFMFTILLTTLSSVVIPICSALLIDSRCLASLFKPSDTEPVIVTEQLCSASAFLHGNCTGSNVNNVTFVSRVAHPFRLDATCPAAVIQLYGPIWMVTVMLTGVLVPGLQLLADTATCRRVVRPIRLIPTLVRAKPLAVGSTRYMRDVFRGYAHIVLNVTLASSIGILYPYVGAACGASMLCKSIASTRLLASARKQDSLDRLTGARGMPSSGVVVAVILSVAVLALFAQFGLLSGVVVTVATAVNPIAALCMFVGVEYGVRKWWRQQGLPLDSEALHGSESLKRGLSTRVLRDA